MPTAKARVGDDLAIKKRLVRFSFWPTGEGARRDFLQSRIFASNPWEIIRNNAVRLANTASKEQVEALIFQGEDLFKAANSADIKASRPLLLYYAFLQLAKAYCIVEGTLGSALKVQHGVNEELPAGGVEFEDSKLTYHERLSSRGTENVFAALFEALTGDVLAKGSIAVPILFNQILIGHRLYTQLREENERFVEVAAIRILKDSARKELWCQMRVSVGDLSRLGYANKELVTAPSMRSDWAVRRVEGSEVPYEMTKPKKYTGRPSDVARDVAKSVMPCVWASVLTAAPYRRYYLYRATGITPMLPQLISMYGCFYYLGSLTRYRPANFRALIDDRKSGPPIVEFLYNQPMQFLYLFASIFARQEVTRAAIV